MYTQPFTIIHEDANIIAVNKVSGIAVGGDHWDEDAPRLDKLLAAFRVDHSGASSGRLYTVHRIDKGTSGLVVFAKNAETHRDLSLAFEKRRVEKHYTAIVYGRPHWPDGSTTCALPLLPDNAKHLTVIDKYRGKASLTVFRLVLSAGNYSVVEARPETGRTHQIRVHLAALGYPVVCDPRYGKHNRSGGRAAGGKTEGVYLSSFKRDWRGNAAEERPLLSRLGLHASRLVLPAAENQTLELTAPLPKDMGALIKQMEKCSKAALPD
ncbi:MAG: RluA family pseudouridine synthase [Treponema sp.]|jgi:RluA family pseudouridine synthase|nr:RluA family pseudouridine synthase [Treponema sp.]